MSNYHLQLHDGSSLHVELCKERDGWQAKTRIDLDDKRVLTVTTRKKAFKKSLSTSASVSQGNGFSETHVFAPGVMGDFRMTYIERIVERITDKAVREQHDRFLLRPDGVAELKMQIYEHYQAQAAKKALEKSQRTQQSHQDCEVRHG